jgi:hypothetical protein
MELFSRLLVGRPYIVDPLGGSPGTPERLTASLRGFDCVTYVESVLALSRARRPAAFAGELKRLRYAGGEVAWRKRNHYMTGWIRENARRGVLSRLRPGDSAVCREKLLDAVPGLAPRRERLTLVPKARLAGLAPRLRTGDLLFFGSTKAHLDVFHCGVLVADGGAPRLRHATRSRGRVVEEDLFDFLRRNRMSGVLVARPR